jgi:hypothetical protein
VPYVRALAAVAYGVSGTPLSTGASMAGSPAGGP